MKRRFTIFSILLTVGLMLSGNLSQAQQLNPSVDSRRAIKPKNAVNKPITEQKSTMSQYGTVTMTVLLDEYTFPYDISADAEHIAISGFDDELSYYWSADGGIQYIEGVVYGVSDNEILAGYYTNPDLQYNGSDVVTGGTWSPQTTEWTFLGMNPTYPDITSYDYNTAWGIDASGTTVVGMQYYNGFDYTTFKWTNDGGYEIIGDPNSDGSRPNGISRDGSVIFGWADVNNLSRTPVLWNNGSIIYIDDNYYGEAFAASSDGFYATGIIGDDCFLWQNDGSDAILFSNAMNDGMISPTAVMDDGTVLGFTNEFWPPFPDTRVAFVRHIDGTMESFNNYAEARGMTEAQAWTFFSINAVTPDGNNFIGAGLDPQGNVKSFLLSFEEEAVSYSLGIEVAPSAGGTATGAGSYTAGTMVDIEATANVGYSFENWTDEQGTVISDSQAYTLEMPENDLTITANFVEILSYNLSIEITPSGSGSATGTGAYPAGTMVEIEATSNTDYAFDSWTDEQGNVISDLQVYTFEMPDNDIVLTANFVYIGTYELTIEIAPNDGGSTTGTGAYVAGTMVEIEAVPNTDYAFDNWTDEQGTIISNLSVYTIEMPGNDLLITANFVSTVGLESNNESAFKVYPNPADQQLNLELKDNTGVFRLFDAGGRLVMQKEIAQKSEQVDISSLKNGIYKAVISTSSDSYFQQIMVIR